MDYRQEAIRLSQYYRQVADDIQWYDEENQRIKSRKDNVSIEKKWLDNRIVVVGLKRNEKSYHANLQEVVKDELRSAPTIRRRYGYVLDMDGIGSGDFIKRREYLMIENSDYKKVPTENLCTLPAGMYAVFVLHIQDERADFSPFLAWLEANGETAEALFAEELGLQLFDYLGDYYCEIRALLKSE